MLAGSAGLGQIVVLASTPVLSRIYSPKEFAVFSVFSALSAVLMVLPALRLELRVPIEMEEEEARRTAMVALQCTAVFAIVGSLLLGTVLIFYAEALRGWDVTGWLWLLPVSAASTAAIAVLNQWAIRSQEYVAISVRNISRNSTMVLIQLALGLFWDSAAGLLLGFVFANLIATATMCRSLRIKIGDLFVKHNALGLVSKLRNFSAKMVFSGFLNLAGIQLPIVIFALYFSTTETGQLGMAQRVLSLPIAIVGLAIGQVFLGKFASASRGGSGGRKIFLSSTIRLLFIAAVLSVTTALLGPILVPWLLGAAWSQSGQFTAILALGVAAQLVASPLSQVLIVLGRLKLQIAWDIGRLVIVLSAVILVGEFNGSGETAVLALSVAFVVTYAVQWLLSFFAVVAVERPPTAKLIFREEDRR